MNNPLEAVTQAVNSLVTALKLPDESAKANEVLGEMSFPQFSRLLPYRDYNQESGLFMNDTTMGFMLEAIPINGANESIVEALDHMLRTKLPRGVPFCIHLMSSQLVGDRIEYGLREFSWSGEQAERFNAITRAYYMNAAATQFPLPEGMNLPLTLRHYRVFFSYCSPSKKKSRADILEMENLVKIIRASLQGASITTQTVDAQAFIDIVGEMINHNPDSLYPKRRQLDPYSDLNYQCVEDSFDLKVRADYLTLGLRENGRNSTARILNFHLARNALKSQITKLLASIQNKAVSDTPLDDKEKGFISSTTIPVFKYLVDPQMLGVSNSMIYQLTDYIGYDILLQYIQELIQQARAMVATGNYDEAVIEHINDNMNDATRQIAAFQSQVQVQQDALLVVDRQMSYMRQQLSARMLSRYQNNYHFGGSTL